MINNIFKTSKPETLATNFADFEFKDERLFFKIIEFYIDLEWYLNLVFNSLATTALQKIPNSEFSSFVNDPANDPAKKQPNVAASTSRQEPPSYFHSVPFRQQSQIVNEYSNNCQPNVAASTSRQEPPSYFHSVPFRQQSQIVNEYSNNYQPNVYSADHLQPSISVADYASYQQLVFAQQPENQQFSKNMLKEANKDENYRSSNYHSNNNLNM